MKYKLLATDYDLTFTRSDRTISERVKRAVRTAEEAGIRVVLATGRLPIAAAAPLRFFSPDTPAILGNGGILRLPRTGEHLWEALVPEEAVLPVYDWLCRQEGGACLLWTRTGLYSPVQNAYTAEYAKVVGCEPRPVSSIEKLAEEGVYKLLFASLPENALRIQSAFREDPQADVSYFRSAPFLLEFVPKGVNKGVGLTRLAGQLGIRLEETAAIGDSENDISMLRAAGLSAAMGNASDDVRAAADMTVPTCDEDGMAWFVENVLLKS